MKTEDYYCFRKNMVKVVSCGDDICCVSNETKNVKQSQLKLTPEIIEKIGYTSKQRHEIYLIGDVVNGVIIHFFEGDIYIISKDFRKRYTGLSLSHFQNIISELNPNITIKLWQQ